MTDNGTGIAKEELMLALSRHATSKVSELDDLENICTLGFRGEALASISAVSRLSLTSKTQQQSEAWQARCEGRDMHVLVEPAAHPEGTSVEVLDLFFNTPARRKFLRTEKTEFNHIEELFNRIALSRYDIGLRLKHNGKVLKNLPPILDNENKLKRVKQLFGSSVCDGMLEICGEYRKFRLTGWLSATQHYRAMNDVQFVFVNNRMMRDKLIFHAVRQSYEGLLAEDKFPFFVLYLQVPHNEVDVNVHPAKHEVRFHQSRLIHDFIFSSINDALQQSAQPLSTVQSAVQHDYVPSQKAPSNVVTHNAPQEPDTHYIQPLQIKSYEGVPQSNTSNTDDNFTIHNQSVRQDGKHRSLREAAANYTSLMKLPEDFTTDQAPSRINTQLLEVRNIGIVVSFEERHYLIKKLHLCLPLITRIISSGVTQPLLIPVSITTESVASNAFLALAKELGIDLQQVNKKLILKQVPAGTRHQNWHRIMGDLAERLSTDKKSDILEILASHWDLERDLGSLWAALDSAQQGTLLEEKAVPVPLTDWLLAFVEGKRW